MELENYTRDGGAIEYSKAANPLANGTTPPMPIFEFPPDNYEGRPTGITPLDLSELLKCDSPASSPGLLSSFIHVTAGDTLTVRLEILEKLPKFRVRIATRVFNQRDELVVDGEAEILAPRKQQVVTLTELPPISIG